MSLEDLGNRSREADYVPLACPTACFLWENKP